MPAVKLGAQDIIILALGFTVMLLIMLMSTGKQEDGDPQTEHRLNKKYLDALARHRSLAMTMAMLVALAGLAYGVIAAYYKSL